ncbi:DUF397 domain-containing protein [Actinoplanes sp. NPDC051411]|uniref:DUF397 domain-containing protein n=1 Tax=Actinoplanes sp. NPDC051411 TaxID=3155522 RepID=UPI00343CD491
MAAGTKFMVDQCVEVATNLPGLVPVRDMKDREGRTPACTADSWVAFVDGVKSGEFDLPA